MLIFCVFSEMYALTAVNGVVVVSSSLDCCSCLGTDVIILKAFSGLSKLSHLFLTSTTGSSQHRRS